MRTLPELLDKIRKAVRRNTTIPLALELIAYYTLNTKFLAGATFMALVCWMAH